VDWVSEGENVVFVCVCGCMFVFEEEGCCVVITGRGLEDGRGGGGIAFESASAFTDMFADTDDFCGADGDVFSLSFAGFESGFVDEVGGSLPGGGDVGIDCWADMVCYGFVIADQRGKLRSCGTNSAVR
jgi:hypothetical protein